MFQFSQLSTFASLASLVRYGTESAMVVHSSICNPWFYSFFGTLAMALGQLFGPALFPIMSNTGILIFIITILLLMAEVDKDIVATHDVACFLVQVAQKGDQIRVGVITEDSRASNSEHQQTHGQFRDEEEAIESLGATEGISNAYSPGEDVASAETATDDETKPNKGTDAASGSPNA